MDGTLKQLLAEIYACHREIEDLRRQLKALQDAQAAAAAGVQAKPGPPT